MKAIILTAGKGTRMLPLTEKIPKVLIPINGKPFLWYVIENLKKAGYHEWGIVVGYLHEQIADFVRQHKIKATIIPQEKPLGTGHAVLQAKQFCGTENFVVLGGDNLFSVADLKQVHHHDDFCYVVGKQVDDPQRYGVLLAEKDRLIKIVEKPQLPIGNLINIGLYKFTPDIWTALSQIELSPRGEYELTDAITLLAKQNKVKVLPLQDYWLDLGSKEDIPKIEEFLASNKSS